MKQVSTTEIEKRSKDLEESFNSKKAEHESIRKQIEQASQRQQQLYQELVSIQGAWNALRSLLPEKPATPVDKVPAKLKAVKASKDAISAPKTAQSE
jgi:chromosome segregation ATPase